MKKSQELGANDWQKSWAGWGSVEGKIEKGCGLIEYQGLGKYPKRKSLIWDETGDISHLFSFEPQHFGKLPSHSKLHVGSCCNKTRLGNCQGKQPITGPHQWNVLAQGVNIFINCPLKNRVKRLDLKITKSLDHNEILLKFHEFRWLTTRPHIRHSTPSCKLVNKDLTDSTPVPWNLIQSMKLVQVSTKSGTKIILFQVSHHPSTRTNCPPRTTHNQQPNGPHTKPPRTNTAFCQPTKLRRGSQTAEGCHLPYGRIKKPSDATLIA